MNRVIEVGIGFATGRKSFQNVLKTYIYNWKESGLVANEKIHLNLFVAYDLTYHDTQPEDYTKIPPRLLDLIDDVTFIGPHFIKKEKDYLINEGILSGTEAELILGRGYAGQRNALLYTALKRKMQRMVFLDDDEYPVAVTRSRGAAVWGGQHVLSSHLQAIHDADITHGYHCGYISPIPTINFDDALTEDDFRVFISAISNDIVKWESIRQLIASGGVTYGNTEILTSDLCKEVQEINGAKFISGANLCINLRDPARLFPFYNPPGARGEDTFLSTCLTQRRVLKVPTYTFHDGFGVYQHLLQGVLPISLKPVSGDDPKNITRFYKACLGWIRYKPLLLHLTYPDTYQERIQEIEAMLQQVLPKICNHFNTKDFMMILRELRRYHRRVLEHHALFNDTKSAWAKMMAHFSQ